MHDCSQNDTRTHITNPGPDPEANTNGACIFDPIEAVLLLYTIPVPIGGFGHTIPVLVSAISVEFIPEGRGEEGAELYPAKANHAELSEGVRSAPLQAILEYSAPPSTPTSPFPTPRPQKPFHRIPRPRKPTNPTHHHLHPTTRSQLSPPTLELIAISNSDTPRFQKFAACSQPSPSGLHKKWAHTYTGDHDTWMSTCERWTVTLSRPHVGVVPVTYDSSMVTNVTG